MLLLTMMMMMMVVTMMVLMMKYKLDDIPHCICAFDMMQRVTLTRTRQPSIIGAVAQLPCGIVFR